MKNGKKKKITIISIVLVAVVSCFFLLFSGKKVCACERIEFEEAKEILTAENIMLVYSMDADLFSPEMSEKGSRICLRSETMKNVLCVCEDGTVYYVSFEDVHWLDYKDFYGNISGDEWTYEPQTVYYLGKMSMRNLLKIRMHCMLLDYDAEYYEATYRYVEESPMSEGGGALDSDAGNLTREEALTNLYEESENPHVQRFLDCSYFSLDVYGGTRNCNIGFKSFDIKRYSTDSHAEAIWKIVKDSSFFEQYAVLAFNASLSGGVPVAEEECAFLPVQAEEAETQVLFGANRREGASFWVDEEYIYMIESLENIYRISIEDFYAGKQPELYLALGSYNYVWQMILHENTMVCCMGIDDFAHGSVNKVLEDGTIEPLLPYYSAKIMLSVGEWIYCSDYNSLYRVDLDGNAEELWSNSVFSIDVDENYIYIFDGNSWQILDAVTGEYLGWLVTGIAMDYEVDMTYVYNDRLYFVKQGYYDGAVSCSVLDLSGEEAVVGEIRLGSEQDTYRVVFSGEYIFYTANDGETLVRLNVNDGQEATAELAEYYANPYVIELRMVEDHLLIYLLDEQNEKHYLLVDSDTMEISEWEL